MGGTEVAQRPEGLRGYLPDIKVENDYLAKSISLMMFVAPPSFSTRKST